MYRHCAYLAALLVASVWSLSARATVADDLSTALDSAMAVYNKCFVCTYSTQDALITEAEDEDPDHNQFSSNAAMPKTSVYGYYKDIIDGNPATFFITKHTSKGVGELPEGLHYIQVDLRQQVEAFAFMYQRNTKWTGFTWKDVIIYASNDPEGPWTQVTTLNDLPNVAEANYYGPYKLDAKYRYLRFDVAKVHNTNAAVGGGQAFCIGEMQVYAASVDQEASAACQNEALMTTCQELAAAIQHARSLDPATATAKDVNTLMAAVTKTYNLYRGDDRSDELKALLSDARALYASMYALDYDVDDVLITEADDEDPAHNQFSSNAKMPDQGATNWGRYAYLIDDDPDTYFFTQHDANATTPPTGLHYLQVDLRRNDISAFAMYHAANPYWQGNKFEWRTVLVYGANDPEGEWTQVARLKDLPDEASYTVLVNMGTPYRYVRFAAESTYRNLKVGGGECFCIGDFQLYATTVDEVNSFAYNIDGLNDACAELQAAILTASACLSQGGASSEDLVALQAAVDKVDGIYKNTDHTAALQALVDKAEQAYNDLFVYNRTPLLYEADDDDPAHNQISSNAKMPDYGGANWGRYANLIDGNPNTFFFTIHNTAAATPPAGYHNIQFDLRRNDVSSFSMYHAANPTWHAYKWEMRTVQVLATNDPDGEWTFIKRLELPDADSYTTELIELGDCYRYIRYDVEDVYYHLKTGGGYCFCIGDLQLYKVDMDEEKSAYNRSAAIKAAADELLACINEKKEVLGYGEIVPANEVSELKAKLAALEALVQKAEIDATGYATAVYDQAVIVPEGMTAYVVESINEDAAHVHAAVYAEAGDIIPAGTPVILQAAPGTYMLTTTTGGTAPAKNLLCGDATKNTSCAGLNAYVLSTRSDNAAKVAFCPVAKTDEMYIPAGKAYLPVANGASPAYSLVFGDVTGIGATTTTAAPAVYYNLQGQPVKNPAKGQIYILNGKKIIK